jgi:hypothetical protein
VLRSCEFVAAGLVTLLLVLLHIQFCRSAGPLWRDEVSSLCVATMPTLKQCWKGLIFENHPALHYVVLRAWCALGFGATDFGLRVLGLIISLLLISALWISGWIFHRSAPLLPLTFFALNKFTLRADSLRPHGLALVWLVLAFALIWQLTFQPQRGRTIILATICAVLSVQTLFLNAFLLGAICVGSIVVLAWRRAWRAAAWTLGIGLIAALSLLPYVPMIREASKSMGIRAIAHSVGYIAWSFVRTLTMEDPIADVVFVFLILSILALAVVPALRKRVADEVERVGENFRFAAISSSVAAIGTIGFLWMLKFPLNGRYYVPLMAVIALSSLVMTAALRRWTAVRLVTLVGSVILAAAFFCDSAGYVKMRLTNCDLAAEAVAQRAVPDDVIILTRFAYGITFQRYYRSSVPWHTIPDISDYGRFRWDLVKETMIQTDPMRELLVRMELALRSGHNVFVVGQFGSIPVVQPQPHPPAPLTSYGWNMESYLTNWREQVSYLVDQHSRSAETVPLSEKERVDLLERVDVYVISGWR